MIQDIARELGVALASSPEFIRFRMAQAAIESNEAITALRQELNVKRTALVGLLQSDESEGALALELTTDVERLEGQLMENKVFAELMEAHSAFSTLLNMVNAEIDACIGDGPSVSAACGGNCSACGGCKN